MASSSFWLQDNPFQNYRSSPSIPDCANVVVIGGGLSGVSTAYWLRKNGVEDIVIVEQRGISNGATGRNGGHCWPTPHIYPDDWIAKYGKSEMNQIRKFDLENIRLIREFLDSDPKVRESVEFHTLGGIDAVPKSHSGMHEKEMRYDYDAILASNIEDKDVFWWDEEKCKKEMGENTIFSCGLGQEKATQLWPAKLVFAILQKTLDMGNVRVYTQTKVVSEKGRCEEGYVVGYEMEVQGEGNEGEKDREEEGEEEGEERKVLTGEIKCKKVVYAVNAWIPTLLPMFKQIVTPVKGQVLVTSPVSQPLVLGGQSLGLGFEISDHGGKGVRKGREEENEDEDEEKEEGGDGDEEGSDIDDGDDDLFYVIRRVKDNRVVVGTRVARKKGATEEELYNDKNPNDETTKELEDFLETFPTMKKKEDGSREWKVEHVWQGVMGFTKDDLPLVGPLRDKKKKNKGKGKKQKRGKTKEIGGGEGDRKKREYGRYILGGYNGDGMPKCFGSGKAISEMIIGELDPEDFLRSFSPARFL